MKVNTFYTILPFMVNDLKLSGNELLIYAIIYGFSQDGESWFYGSREYVSGCTNISKASVTRCLKALTEKGYIERKEVTDKKGTHVEYRASKESLQGGVVKNLNGGSKESLPNNKDNNNSSKDWTGKSINEEINREDVWELVEHQETPFVWQCVNVFNNVLKRSISDVPPMIVECLNRRADRYSLDEIAGMIRMKRDEWAGTKMESNLKPTTLFSANHFDEYMDAYRHRNDEREFSDDEIPY